MSNPTIWSVTDHICGQCLGRLLSHGASGRGVVYRCAECGEVGAGRQGLEHPPICMCASRVGERNAGIRCVPNPSPSADRPWEIIAREVKSGNESRRGGVRKKRGVACDKTGALPDLS